MSAVQARAQVLTKAMLLRKLPHVRHFPEPRATASDFVRTEDICAMDYRVKPSLEAATYLEHLAYSHSNGSGNAFSPSVKKATNERSQVSGVLPMFKNACSSSAR